MKIPAQALENSRRTLQSYEASARAYNAIVAEHPLQPEIADAMRRMMQFVPPGGTVLEIGSGPGRDADFVESLGGTVRRTDAVQAFLDLQAERGKKGELLDVVTDALGGPYDAVLAMCVLIHVERTQVGPVLRKVFDALAPGGAFLVSMRVGEGETNGECHTVLWAKERFAEALAAAGLRTHWEMERIGRNEEAWVYFLALRPQ
ncbi:methyltransferase type 12 [Variovorax sp. KBW07]|uniref:class I SAM-dependent DNA methyltransferase n=1 Tax=Variovorax sp. KBW07 TaxID=2153358 RepID=UPI000F576961|nr:class I SAM-dependent methyltransferase [Variovorax sp. KBW07]RQO47489.1 methyltransferase type 12 [Variovorax sp. KBW07]